VRTTGLVPVPSPHKLVHSAAPARIRRSYLWQAQIGWSSKSTLQFLSAHGIYEKRGAATSTKRETGDTDRSRATSKDIDTHWDQIFVDLHPGEPYTQLHRTQVFVDDMSLNLANEMCTPGVDENPGLRLQPPPFTANGVSIEATLRSYKFRM
jgi:hypothetical protein